MQFTVEKTDFFEIHLRKEDIGLLLKDKPEDKLKVKLEIDGGNVIDLELSDTSVKEKWVSLGSVHFQEGVHKMVISLPELPNYASSFKDYANQINNNSDVMCYVSKLTSFDNKRIYKISLDYLNDFSNQIYFYINKKQNNTNIIDQVARLESKLEKHTHKSIVYPNSNTTAVSIEVCSKNLTQETLNDKIKLTINEVIHPTIIFVSSDQKTPSVNNVSYVKVSPTKYIIETGIIERPSILVFSDRFSPGWELEMFDAKHIRFNGYVNGWFIDKPGEYRLKLEYKPQRLFIYGIMVTAISALASIIILVIDKRPRGKI